MVNVYGAIGCANCATLKASLAKGSYNFLLLNSLSEQEQDELIDKAELANASHMPIITIDGEVLAYKSIAEAISKVKNTYERGRDEQ